MTEKLIFDSTAFSEHLVSGKTNIIGVGYDKTASFRKGTIAGPDAIRQASCQVETYSAYQDKDLLDFELYDLGNVEIDQGIHPDKCIEKLIATYLSLFSARNLDKNTKLLTLGGEHSISIAPLSAYLQRFPELLVIHLDAHADLRDGYMDFKYSHAAVLRRYMDLAKDPAKLIQFGIRSGTKDEFDWMKKNKTLIFGRQNFFDVINKIPAATPIYLTFDVDFLDPSIFPGTGTPEAGGENFDCLIQLFKILHFKNFVGADIVELSPPIDPTGNSTIIASKIVREMLLTLSK
ncbi:MAG: agmatinase [Bdellovibrionales bacterium RIFOXYD12_FULL_39_22]|nr:MAG: agmatinase [Bdellovibrionales bacterium RIFOXYB1_FULL_39_21]OFZ43414.1 MAG: agmatinase [Bdellovibrionales bacterium RIFOXYC12_FULL_39_17]OFZ46957.1 MAG: agmatinase [Bdellovibrionales bacterium RIFOXYC1_FULL_39_130]OFZ72221.1 MAG: agmatinase [Bdellovibrionales bacterium RIFOXYC2_FULL_39_8]OFZ76154.1 MAG: agmatinase [Bdellovibrionales bacterium RIFOXYD1_FULL_39_84]OFZ94389.1 MAG: agmatinase [Bdellovibrionales bacterium RIFOXYD12_FULL_39_22]HLE10571.1 agmatinase [Bacteriovoracaceae bacte